MAAPMLRAARGHLAGSAAEALLFGGRGSSRGAVPAALVRRMSERVLSEEEKAAENVYFKKLEHEKLEKLHARLEQQQLQAESAQAKADEAMATAKAAQAAAESASAGGAAGSSASGALYALGGVAVGILGMYLLGPKK